MTRSASSSARGQILMITAVAMLVLFGIAALVVDLGFSWMLRRQSKMRPILPRWPRHVSSASLIP